jgi:hypothetical protein
MKRNGTGGYDNGAPPILLCMIPAVCGFDAYLSGGESLDSRLAAIDDWDMERSGKRFWRRYTRFSLRGLIALVLIVGGWLGWMARSAQVQRDAVAAIRRSGGWVWYDWHFKNGIIDRTAQPWAPKWLANPVDAGLAHLAGLRSLQSVELGDIRVTDAGLKHLEKMTDLRDWGLFGTSVSDAGLAHLAGLRSLQSVELGDTRVTDAGVQELQKALPDAKIFHGRMSSLRSWNPR